MHLETGADADAVEQALEALEQDRLAVQQDRGAGVVEVQTAELRTTVAADAQGGLKAQRDLVAIVHTLRQVLCVKG